LRKAVNRFEPRDGGCELSEMARKRMFEGGKRKEKEAGPPFSGPATCERGMKLKAKKEKRNLSQKRVLVCEKEEGEN